MAESYLCLRNSIIKQIARKHLGNELERNIYCLLDEINYNHLGINGGDMMEKCFECGKILLENAKFCNKCGNPVIKDVPKKIEVTDAQKCPNCNKELPNAAKFCNYCGASLTLKSLVNPEQDKTGFRLSRKNIWYIASALLIVIVGYGFNFMLPRFNNTQSQDVIKYLQQQASKADLNIQDKSANSLETKTTIEGVGLTEQDLRLAGLATGDNVKDVVKLYGNPAKRRIFQWNNSNFEEYTYDGLKVVVLVNSNVNNGKIFAVEVSIPRYATVKGIKVGDSMTKVTELYGKPKNHTDFIDKDTKQSYRSHHYFLKGGSALNFIADLATNLIVEISVDSWSI